MSTDLPPINTLPAVPSVGLSVSFDGSLITGVTGLDWSWASGPSKGRSVWWTDESGEVSVEYYGAGPGTTAWNKLGVLVISGGGMDLACDAICGPTAAKATVNGITTYSVNFKIYQ